MKLFVGLAVSVGLLLLVPEHAYAWGPGTHIALGQGLLGSLHLLPPEVASLLARHPIHFLYGSVAADISFGKKYVPEGRHCHAWHVGEEILDKADSEALRATGYGYLSHLAADTIAHNYFVPRKLLLTSSTTGLGHTYWEMRMDAHVGEHHVSRARRLVLDHDHAAADAHFDDILSHTLFSFQTNRRIFRGMVKFHDNQRWKKVFDQVLKNSRFELPELKVRGYLALSFDYVVDYLNRGSGSLAAQLDPVGELNLKMAKKFRRVALSKPVPSPQTEVVQAADEFFPLPEPPHRHWEEAGENGNGATEG